MRELNKDTHYWVKTNGYECNYTCIYRNADGSWRISVDDRVLFISDYKLELLYGKNCVLREFNKETDLINLSGNAKLPIEDSESEEEIRYFTNFLQTFKKKRQVQILIEQSEELCRDFIATYYPMFNAYDITYGFVKLEKGENVLDTYSLLFYNPYKT